MKKNYCKTGKIRFNLKLNDTDKEKPAQIFMIFNFDGKRLRYYTGERIHEKNWNKVKQRAKSQYSDSSGLNNTLDSIAEFTIKEYRDARILEKKLTVDYLKSKLDNRNSKTGSNPFYEAIEHYIEVSKNEYTPKTIKNYNTVLNHVKAFSLSKNYHIEFNSIDLKFDEKFRDYLLNDVKITNNSLAKYVKTVKRFMNYAFEKGLHTNTEYLKFKAKTYEPEIIFLSMDVLMKLYNLKISLEKYRRVRDVFCFGCFTGLRYSDIKNLKKDNIKDGFIHVNTIKTTEPTTIPITKHGTEIIERYSEFPGDFLLPALSMQRMNTYLKDLAEFAKIDEKILIIKYKGAERIETYKPFHELLTTHVARKTFITNALEKGMPTEVIMDITTHKSHRTFKRYYKIQDDFKKKEMEKVFG
jgi:integrase